MCEDLVRSHLDYCDIIYHIPTLQNQPPAGVTLNSIMAKAESIQYQAALEELGWESLADRRWCRRLIQVHKNLNNTTPSYITNKLPPIRKPLPSRTSYNTFHEIRWNYFRNVNNFFLGAITSWNNIIKHSHNTTTAFKYS